MGLFVQSLGKQCLLLWWWRLWADCWSLVRHSVNSVSLQPDATLSICQLILVFCPPHVLIIISFFSPYYESSEIIFLLFPRIIIFICGNDLFPWTVSRLKLRSDCRMERLECLLADVNLNNLSSWVTLSPWCLHVGPGAGCSIIVWTWKQE